MIIGFTAVLGTVRASGHVGQATVLQSYISGPLINLSVVADPVLFSNTPT